MEELELREYWAIIRKRWKLVLILPFLLAIVSGLLSFFVIQPEYKSETTLLVNQKPSNTQNVQYDAIMASQALVKTYSDIIKSNTVEQQVVSNLQLPFPVSQLDKMVTVSAPDQSEVIQVNVTSKSASLSTDIANALASVFQTKAQSLMEVQNVQIVDPAVTPAHPVPVKPNKKLNIAIAFILGLMVSVGIAFLLEYLDNRIRTEEDVRRYLNLPVLGGIMDYEIENK